MSSVNALANFAFLTQETNLEISDKAPSDYLPTYLAKHPGAVESHWLPTDPELWKVENYPDFLDARRALLAKAANDFLDQLLVGGVAEGTLVEDVFEGRLPMVCGGVANEEEEDVLVEMNIWVSDQGLPEGEFMYELTDESTGEPLAVFDLAWPEGMQEGLSKPVALLLDEPPETLEAANAAGYLFFTDVAEFRRYVERDVLALEMAEVVLQNS